MNETHEAPLIQTTPHPGEQPAPLSEIAGPQRSDRTLRHSGGDAPSLAMPVLAAESDEATDSATVSFLVQRALEVKKKEEEAKSGSWRSGRRHALKQEFVALLDILEERRST